MESQVVIWILVVYSCVAIIGKKLSSDIGVNQDQISSDVHNQSKTHVTINGKQLLGYVDRKNYLSIDVYNQSKTHVKLNNHQLGYYEHELLCPNAKDIAPCVCTYYSSWNVMDLNCSAVESEGQLRQIFKADFPFKKFGTFTMTNNKKLIVLEKSVFNGISFEIIKIETNLLEVIEMHALDSCYETAYGLYFTSNGLIHFPFEDISQFSKLTNFRLEGNFFLNIPAEAFSGLTTLEDLNLDLNLAKIIGSFENLPNLRVISLYGNVLTTIPSNFINAGSPYLQVLFLPLCHIVSVEPGAFDIVEGQEIYIQHNSLSTLEEATWRPALEAGGVLYASLNPLDCGCDIAWLFREDHLLTQIGWFTTCSDGEIIHDLDPKIFDLC